MLVIERGFNYSSRHNLPKCYKQTEEPEPTAEHTNILISQRVECAAHRSARREDWLSELCSKPPLEVVSGSCQPLSAFTHVPPRLLRKPNLGFFLLLPPLTQDLPYAHGSGPQKGWGVFLVQVSGRPVFSACSCPLALQGLFQMCFPIL